MKSIIRLAIVAGLVFLLINEPPKQQAVAEAKPVDVVQQTVTPTPEPTPTPPVAEPVVEIPPVTNISLSKQEIMTAAGINPNDWAAVDYIISHESSWRYEAVNSSSGATGLCQSLPASKMSSAGGDYLTNPVTQLLWCDSYAQARYGGWWSAYNFWQANRWW